MNRLSRKLISLQVFTEPTGVNFINSDQVSTCIDHAQHKPVQYNVRRCLEHSDSKTQIL